MNDAFTYIWFAGLNRSAEGVHVEWQADSTHGTHYHAAGEVHLEGDDWGTPANLPPSDTMVHEYGHAVMYNVYGDVFPPHDCPESHFIQQTSGIVCAWTEGFADFLVVPVNGGSSYDWPSGSSLDLETPTWNTPGWDTEDMVEGRVAGALLDIFDGTNEGTDAITRGFDEIWDTFYSQNDDTFLQFFTAWRNLGYGDCFTDAANTIGKCAQVLCSTAEATGAGAGAVILRIPAGALPAGATVTFQGVVKDLSDVDSTQQYSVTNAVIVRMTP